MLYLKHLQVSLHHTILRLSHVMLAMFCMSIEIAFPGGSSFALIKTSESYALLRHGELTN